MFAPKYPRTWHFPFSPEIHSDDKTHKDPELFIGREVVITEKMDGGNVLLHEGKVYARSTGQVTTHSSFSFIKTRHAHKTLNDELFFYGENLQALHSIPYTVPDYFMLFAVRDKENWWAWDGVTAAASVLEFLTVPVLFCGSFKSLGEIQDWMERAIQLPGTYSRQREGFVLRVVNAFPVDQFTTYVAKFVREGHIQSEEHWSDNWRPNKLLS